MINRLVRNGRILRCLNVDPLADSKHRLVSRAGKRYSRNLEPPAILIERHAALAILAKCPSLELLDMISLSQERRVDRFTLVYISLLLSVGEIALIKSTDHDLGKIVEGLRLTQCFHDTSCIDRLVAFLAES